jgi:hypothetical protein
MFRTKIEIAEINKRRDKIEDDYCAQMGWDKDNLSESQILEIKRLPDWDKVLEDVTSNGKKTIIENQSNF